jgi:hypothetical protein
VAHYQSSNGTTLGKARDFNSFGTARSEELAMHPTVKPVELVADAILDASRRGGILLDPFAGNIVEQRASIRALARLPRRYAKRLASCRRGVCSAVSAPAVAGH